MYLQCSMSNKGLLVMQGKRKVFFTQEGEKAHKKLFEDIGEGSTAGKNQRGFNSPVVKRKGGQERPA